VRPQIERILRKVHRLGITPAFKTEQILNQPVNITPRTHMPTPPNEKREARNVGVRLQGKVFPAAAAK
jgi:hypothetical protein